MTPFSPPIKGKHFDKDIKVFIGGKEASSVNRKNSKLLTAKFCLDKLLDNKTDHIRIVSVKNPSTKERKADKQIDLNNLSYENENYFDQRTKQGTINIQIALNKLGYLELPCITGTYGSITTEAVKKFQRDNGIEPTGFVGPLTKNVFEKKR